MDSDNQQSPAMTAEQRNEYQRTMKQRQKLQTQISNPFFGIDDLGEPVIQTKSKFQLRAWVNLLIIVLSTLQVYILVHSRIYLNDQLIRSFLSIYYDQDTYPQLFQGLLYYEEMQQVTEFKDQIQFAFKNIRQSRNRTFTQLSFINSTFNLKVMYHLSTENRETTYPIDPQIGIKQPFDIKNSTSIQMFLLKVKSFELQISNISLQSQGFKQNYNHKIKYSYQQQTELLNTFDFNIQEGLASLSTSNSKLIKILYFRIFYATVMIIAIIGLLLNFKLVLRTYQVFYEALGLINKENLQTRSAAFTQTEQYVYKWVDKYKINPQQLSLIHYLQVLQFDIIFSIAADSFQIIGAFYLISGVQSLGLVGISCLMSWLTIFKFFRWNKQLVLMYELIKMSLFRVILFFFQFMPVFISFTLLGMCLFPKVSFFASFAKSVTTLVSLMMGDSIQMITEAITTKYSKLLGILYIFAFVLMFMHAIHNTLTSLIKQFFIIQKIELITQQKLQNNEQDCMYLQETKCSLDRSKFIFKIEKRALPIKVTPKIQMDLIRSRMLRRQKRRKIIIFNAFMTLERFLSNQKWLIYQQDMENSDQYQDELIRRLQRIGSILNQGWQRKSHSMMTSNDQ